MGLWIELANGTAEWLSDVEADVVCNELWSSGERGAVTVVGKISHERRRPVALQRPVGLTNDEDHAFRTALDQARHPVDAP
jgi:hypothetical protein